MAEFRPMLPSVPDKGTFSSREKTTSTVESSGFNKLPFETLSSRPEEQTGSVEVANQREAPPESPTDPLHEAADPLGPTEESPPGESDEETENNVDIDELIASAEEQAELRIRQLYEAEIERLEAELARVSPLLTQAKNIRQEALAQATDDIGRFVLQMAKKLAGKTLAVHPEALKSLVTESLNHFPSDDEITIRVSPDQAALFEGLFGAEHRVLADDTLSEGCVVQTQYASIERTISYGFGRLETAVNEWVESQK